jgi:ADP-L-glycero-D-manno-heptose 6-epimerase
MTTVLITGALGFIGKNLYEKSKLEFDKVVSIEEDIFEKDLWKEELIEELGRINPDAIFHVGACSDTLESNVNYMMTRNYEFTKVLVDWSSKNNKQLVYSSSAASYGENGSYPAHLYGWSKYIAEGYIISNGGVALRYFNVYGPGEEHKGKMASIAYQMFVKHNNKESIQLFPGKPTRDFIYIEDVVEANLHALENYETLKGNFYDVGFGESKQFESVLEFLDIPYTHTSELEVPKNYQYFTCANKEKMMKDWTPKHNLKKGIKKYKEYLCKTI